MILMVHGLKIGFQNWEDQNLTLGVPDQQALLPEKVLGIEPILLGWEKFKIKPNLYDLEWCEGIVPSSKGDINVKIKSL